MAASATVELEGASYIIGLAVKTQMSSLGTRGSLSPTSPSNSLSKWGHQLGIKYLMDCGGHSHSNPYSNLPKPLSHSWNTEGCCVLTCWFTILVWATPWNEWQSDHRSNHAQPIKVIFKGFREGKKVLTFFFLTEGKMLSEEQTYCKETENEVFKSIVDIFQRNQLLFQLGSQKTWTHFIFSFQKCKKYLKVHI